MMLLPSFVFLGSEIFKSWDFGQLKLIAGGIALFAIGLVFSEHVNMWEKIEEGKEK